MSSSTDYRYGPIHTDAGRKISVIPVERKKFTTRNIGTATKTPKIQTHNTPPTITTENRHMVAGANNDPDEHKKTQMSNALYHCDYRKIDSLIKEFPLTFENIIPDDISGCFRGSEQVDTLGYLTCESVKKENTRAFNKIIEVSLKYEGVEKEITLLYILYSCLLRLDECYNNVIGDFLAQSDIKQMLPDIIKKSELLNPPSFTTRMKKILRENSVDLESTHSPSTESNRLAANATDTSSDCNEFLSALLKEDSNLVYSLIKKAGDNLAEIIPDNILECITNSEQLNILSFLACDAIERRNVKAINKIIELCQEYGNNTENYELMYILFKYTFYNLDERYKDAISSTLTNSNLKELVPNIIEAALSNTDINLLDSIIQKVGDDLEEIIPNNISKCVNSDDQITALGYIASKALEKRDANTVNKIIKLCQNHESFSDKDKLLYRVFKTAFAILDKTYSNAIDFALKHSDLEKLLPKLLKKEQLNGDTDLAESIIRKSGCELEGTISAIISECVDSDDRTEAFNHIAGRLLPKILKSSLFHADNDLVDSIIEIVENNLAEIIPDNISDCVNSDDQIEALSRIAGKAIEKVDFNTINKIIGVCENHENYSDKDKLLYTLFKSTFANLDNQYNDEIDFAFKHSNLEKLRPKILKSALLLADKNLVDSIIGKSGYNLEKIIPDDISKCNSVAQLRTLSRVVGKAIETGNTYATNKIIMLCQHHKNTTDKNMFLYRLLKTAFANLDKSHNDAIGFTLKHSNLKKLRPEIIEAATLDCGSEFILRINEVLGKDATKWLKNFIKPEKTELSPSAQHKDAWDKTISTATMKNDKDFILRAKKIIEDQGRQPLNDFLNAENFYLIFNNNTNIFHVKGVFENHLRSLIRNKCKSLITPLINGLNGKSKESFNEVIEGAIRDINTSIPVDMLKHTNDFFQSTEFSRLDKDLFQTKNYRHLVAKLFYAEALSLMISEAIKNNDIASIDKIIDTAMGPKYSAGISLLYYALKNVLPNLDEQYNDSIKFALQKSKLKDLRTQIIRKAVLDKNDELILKIQDILSYESTELFDLNLQKKIFPSNHNTIQKIPGFFTKHLTHLVDTKRKNDLIELDTYMSGNKQYTTEKFMTFMKMLDSHRFKDATYLFDNTKHTDYMVNELISEPRNIAAFLKNSDNPYHILDIAFDNTAQDKKKKTETERTKEVDAIAQGKKKKSEKEAEERKIIEEIKEEIKEEIEELAKVRGIHKNRLTHILNEYLSTLSSDEQLLKITDIMCKLEIRRQRYPSNLHKSPSIPKPVRDALYKLGIEWKNFTKADGNHDFQTRLITYHSRKKILQEFPKKYPNRVEYMKKVQEVNQAEKFMLDYISGGSSS